MSLKSSIVNNYKVTRQGWESNIHINERKKIEVHLVLNEHVDRCRIFTMTHMGDNIVGYLACSLLDTAWGGRGWWPGSAATSRPGAAHPLSSVLAPSSTSRPQSDGSHEPWPTLASLRCGAHNLNKHCLSLIFPAIMRISGGEAVVKCPFIKGLEILLELITL